MSAEAGAKQAVEPAAVPGAANATVPGAANAAGREALPPAVPAVVIAGDALVDLTPTTSVNGTAAYEPHPGGSCLNVAVGLGRLQVPVALLARVSTDVFGDLLREHLRESGVSLGHLVDTQEPTTLAAVHLRSGQATYSFYGNGTSDSGLLPEDLAPLPEEALLHLGSIALVFEPVATTLEGLLSREAGRRLISLDPNIRPGIIGDRAAYLRRFAGWIPLVDVVKVSGEDLAWLEPDRGEDEVVEAWLASGVAMVVVTHGAEGARASTAAGTARVGAVPVAVVDTVGAGDAFMSGTLAYLHHHDLLHGEALRDLDSEALCGLLQVAAKVAADTCTRPGAEPPRYEVEQLLALSEGRGLASASCATGSIPQPEGETP